MPAVVPGSVILNQNEIPLTCDPVTGVELLGESLPYVDGAEDELGTILVEVADRSSLSDLLAARIRDWPTMYHLSRQRSNLLRPLSIRPGMRVLDVGAGTGAIARYLGEQGAEVLALEGSLSRARAARTRCEELPNVRVVCGSIEEFDVAAPFDLVVVVGVLEYAEHEFGGGLGPTSFLASVRRLTAEDGVVALAIENQVGLKYVLGYAEDHLGAPWVGVEGYRAPSGVRTYSRRALGKLLEAAGLSPRTWLYPYPDYKLPAVILSEACFVEPDARLLVDQLVRRPVVDHAHPRMRFCDDRAAAEVFVEAGLGEDMANSFLVLAGDAEAARRLVDSHVLAWHFGSERMSRWLRTKKVVQRGDQRVVEAVPHIDTSRRHGWLSQDVAPTEPFVRGPSLERIALDALAQHDTSQLAAVLDAWRSHVAAAARVVEPPIAPTNPFQRATTRHLLPEDHLDIDLANFIRDTEGKLQYVDREWSVSGGPDLDLALTRALWAQAHRLVVSGATLPWPPTMTVDQLTVILGGLCGFAIDEQLLHEWRQAEDSLQELVVGLDPAVGSQQRVSAGTLCRASFPGLDGLPFTGLREDMARLHAELDAARRRVADAEHALDTAREDLAATLGELDLHRARTAQFERRLPVRVYRRLLGRRPPV